METRFDSTRGWETARGEHMYLDQMETSHLFNVLRMFVVKPSRTQAMMIEDIENNIAGVWHQSAINHSNLKAQSIHNITSMDNNATIIYAINSPLGKAIAAKLEKRGVNVQTVLNNVLEDEVSDFRVAKLSPIGGWGITNVNGGEING